MAEQFTFTLVSPERELLSENVDQVDVPGTDGTFGVLPKHAPFMSTISVGVVNVRIGKQTRQIFVRGGFADVTPAGLTILAEEAVPVEDLDRAKIADELRNAEEDLRDADTDDKRYAAQNVVNRLREIQALT